MQRYTIFFITVNALHLSGSLSAHHQELKNCTHSIEYMSSLLAATASGSSKEARHILKEARHILKEARHILKEARHILKEARHILDSVCTVFELLMMGG